MLLLEQNIKGICDRHGLTFRDFLSDMEVEEVNELTVYDLEAIAEEYELDLYALLFKPVFKSFELKEKLKQIKLLVLDVDGVMTDGGMYFDSEGRQSKKFNAKDGLSILHLTKTGFHVAIISSGFEGGAVQARATILGIQHVSVNREPKINRLDTLLAELGLNYSQTAIIGDDINDLTVMRKVGMTIVPFDAVQVIKEAADLILTKKGGEGCVREFIDNYLLDKPIEE
jgi:3-deoxy-D-manno-octulosonate 8-phosphate phosphatase (KDO 8-P phosphatase)